MKEFYTNLNSFELIIFWGIIIILILLIVLLIISINKKKKAKNIETQEYIEEFPIKLEEITEPEEILISKTEEIELNDEPIEEIKEEESTYFEDLPEKNEEEMIKPEPKEEKEFSKTFEMPTAPYQRNVLREMSLSQTSPIGINRKEDYIKPQDLFETNNNNNNKRSEETLINKTEEIELNDEPIEKIKEEEPTYFEDFSEEDNKLEIERTRYEIEQEENAIISYKELMEKKDSIQTIDEEDAIISIEELINKSNQKKEIKEPQKLYNISETEENDSFINELKQFRKDL